MDKETFGRFIADTRRDKGITQQALADRLHVSNSAVSKWERGLCYPDVTLLEDLACALGLTLTELIAAERLTNATCIESNMSSLLAIANESKRNQRIRILRNALISVLLATLLIFAVYFSVSFFRTNFGSAVYIGSQCKDAQNYVYMDLNGDLLRLHCEDQKMFNSIVSAGREQRYTIEYYWNNISKEGKLKNCQADDQFLGTPMDTLGNVIEIPSLLGIRSIWQEIINVYPDPNHPYCYIYTLRYFYGRDGQQCDFLTVKNCRDFAFCDYDNDGVTELFIVTIYDNAPYMLYDTKDGVISSCFVDNVPKEVLESFNIFIP